MKICAVVAEYNPFHNGHAYHIQQIRNAGYTHVVAVMSGDYVQRGSPAIADSFLRAKAAVLGGVDLVISLPLPWSIAAAPDFAKGAVDLIKSMKIVNAVSFGCECTDDHCFAKLVDETHEKMLQEQIKKELDNGLSYPNAFAAACWEQGRSELYNFISAPNNLLGLEYCRQLKGTDIAILPIHRIGSEHDSDKVTDQFASASYIRDIFYKKYNSANELYKPYYYLPANTESLWKSAQQEGQFPLSLQKFDIAALSRLRCMTADNFLKCPYINAGLENRLFNAVHNSVTFDDACLHAKSRNFSLARIRRSLISAVLDVKPEHLQNTAPYIKVLACNSRGFDILREIKKEESPVIIMRHADSSELNQNAKAIYNLNVAANDLFSLCTPVASTCGNMAKTPTYIHK